MQVIRYQLATTVPAPTPENPEASALVLSDVTMGWSAANEAIAAAEAYQGIYSVEDDGTPAPGPSAEEDRDALIVDHELRLTMLELGV